MTTSFDVSENVIIIRVRLWGPTRDIYADFLLDTGSVDVIVSADLLASIGYDLTSIEGRVRVTTASGVEFLPRLALNKFEALGQERMGQSVLALDLPPSADIDGLLGLNFVRGQQLCIDYRNGTITLS